MKLAKYVSLLFLVLDACIEPFNVKIPAGQQTMVVDGLITDQPGPYTILLYKVLPLDKEFHYPEWVGGASISILDDLGASEKLTENAPGHYMTSTLQGVVGKSYYIRIVTQDGIIY